MHFSAKKYTLVSVGRNSELELSASKLEINAFQEDTIQSASLRSVLAGGIIYSHRVNEVLPKSYKDSLYYHKANVVFADIVFGISNSRSIKYYKFPIRVPSKWIFSLEEGIYNGEERFNFTEGVVEDYQLDDSVLSRFHKLNSSIDKINFSERTESSYKLQFDNHFKHSENALFMYLTSGVVISQLVSDLLGQIGFGTTIIHEITVNIHSTREICQYCAEGVKELLHPEGKFLNRLKSSLLEISEATKKTITFHPHITVSLNSSYFLEHGTKFTQDYQWELSFSYELDFYHTHTCFISVNKDKAGFKYYADILWNYIRGEFNDNPSSIEGYLKQMSEEFDIFKGSLVKSVQKYNHTNEVAFTIEQLDAFTLNVMLLLEQYVDLLDEEMFDVAEIGVRSKKTLERSVARNKKVVDIEVEELEDGELPESLQELFYMVLPLARACQDKYMWGALGTSLAEYIGYIMGKSDPNETQEQLYNGLEFEELDESECEISIYEAIDNLKEWVTEIEPSTSNNPWKDLLYGVSFIPQEPIKNILLFNIVSEYYKTAVSFARYCIEVHNETLGDFTREEHDDINRELKKWYQKNEDTLKLFQEGLVHVPSSNPSGNLWTMFCSQFNKLTDTQKYFYLQQELTSFEGIEGYLYENHVNSLQELHTANGLEIDNSLGSILPSSGSLHTDSSFVDLVGLVEELHLPDKEL